MTTRVLVGHFGALVRAGLEDLLSDTRMRVSYVGADDVYVKVMEELPDVVLLDQDAPGTEAVAERLSVDFPALTVIACSSIDPVMRIYPRFHRGESYTDDVGGDRFTQAIGS